MAGAATSVVGRAARTVGIVSYHKHACERTTQQLSLALSAHAHSLTPHTIAWDAQLRGGAEKRLGKAGVTREALPQKSF